MERTLSYESWVQLPALPPTSCEILNKLYSWPLNNSDFRGAIGPLAIENLNIHYSWPSASLDSTNHELYSTAVVFTTEKSSCISGPMQFKPILFKCWLYILDLLLIFHIPINGGHPGVFLNSKPLPLTMKSFTKLSHFSPAENFSNSSLSPPLHGWYPSLSLNISFKGHLDTVCVCTQILALTSQENFPPHHQHSFHPLSQDDLPKTLIWPNHSSAYIPSLDFHHSDDTAQMPEYDFQGLASPWLWWFS